MRSFFLKLAAFGVVLLTMQVVVAAMYLPKLPKEILALEQQLQAGVDIVYFGDSTLIQPEGEPTIPEILGGMLLNNTIGDVAHPAYQSDLYERYVNHLVEHKSQVETVIIPINMRSFSPEWDLRPTYQFEREKAILTYGPLLSSVFYRAFDTFGLFDPPISQAEFRETPVFNGNQPVGDVAEFEKLIGLRATAAETDFAYYAGLPSENETEALEAMLVYYYMYGLDPDHRKIQSLKTISRLLTENNIKPIFYITPINYQLGERHLGGAFSRRVAENVAVVEQVLRQEGVEVLNLVFDLEAYNFVDTEHLTENGKSYVAETLAAAIEPPRTKPLTSAAVDNPPTSHISTIEQSGQLDQVSSPTPTATRVVPVAAPAPTRTVSVTATLRSLAGQQAGQLMSVEYWGLFEPAGKYHIEVYNLRYKTVDRNERVIEAEASLYVPQVAEQTNFPILVYGPGTTGLSNECAPLNELSSGSNWGAYHSYMLDYTAQGLIGILPNYQGFDEADQIHPYFIAEFQARALLDAARATYNFFDDRLQVAARPMDAVFLAGYSSGGQAAFAAKDFAADYAPELPLKGVIGHGPTTNVETLLKENAVFSPYIVQAYRDFYGPEVVDPVAVFQDRWLASFEADVMSHCVDGIFTYYSTNPRRMYRPEFTEALFGSRLQIVAPAFKAALEANVAGLSPDGVQIPALILQGTADQVVTPPSQRQFAASLCQLGNQVTYISYPAIDHPGIRHASFEDTINWIDSVADGTLPESSCAILTGQ